MSGLVIRHGERPVAERRAIAASRFSPSLRACSGSRAPPEPAAISRSDRRNISSTCGSSTSASMAPSGLRRGGDLQWTVRKPGVLGSESSLARSESEAELAVQQGKIQTPALLVSALSIEDLRLGE